MRVTQELLEKKPAFDGFLQGLFGALWAIGCLRHRFRLVLAPTLFLSLFAMAFSANATITVHHNSSAESGTPPFSNYPSCNLAGLDCGQQRLVFNQTAPSDINQNSLGW